jgi:hypothetical protein
VRIGYWFLLIVFLIGLVFFFMPIPALQILQDVSVVSLFCFCIDLAGIFLYFERWNKKWWRS